MTKYSVTGPDGGRYSIEGPTGMSDAQVITEITRQLGTPQQPEMGWGEYLKGLGREALQGATFGFGDELGITDRAASEQFGAQYPIASTVAGIAGGVAPFVAGPGAALARLAVGSTLRGTVGRSALLGAGVGGVSGAGHGEGGVAERLPSAATGAATGAVFGAAAPPVIAGVGRAAGAAGRMFRAGSGRPSPGYEPPVRPAGSPIENATFTADGAPPPPTGEALSAQEGALRMISDWITSAGGTADDVAGAWQAVQRSGRLHSSGEALNAQTLAEIEPSLQRLLRAGASGYREVGDDATRFLQARQTGIAPATSARDLAQRGIPTRERFLPGRTVQENLDEFGVQLGTGAGNVSPTGQLGRIVDATKRLFRIKDDAFHGHAATAGRTSDEILAAMEREAAPVYTKAFAAGDMVSVRPAVLSVMQRWGQEATQYGQDYRNMIARAFRRFVDADGEPVSRLRAFDKAKQKLDSEIGQLRIKGASFEVRELTRLKNELLEAVDGITQGDLGRLYSEARGIYAGGARNREILEDFKAAWKDDPEAVVARYDALPGEEQRKLARYGIVWGMEAANAGRRGAQDASTMFDVRRAEEMLTLLGRRMRAGESDAEDVMRRFGSYIGGEQEMVRGTARTAVGGSMTDRNLQDALAMGTMEIAQNIQSLQSIWRGSTGGFDMARGLLEWAWNRAFGMSAARAREMSRMLLTANPEEITAIIARLRMTQPASRMARFNELVGQIQSFGAGSAGIAGGMAGAPTPVASGPVSF